MINIQILTEQDKSQDPNSFFNRKASKSNLLIHCLWKDYIECFESKCTNTISKNCEEECQESLKNVDKIEKGDSICELKTY